MPDLAISAHGLGKRYRLGRVESGFRQARRRALRRPSAGHMWALRDVTFDVPEGSSLAVIGKNGAGKSTLLKLLARITEPTAGYADVAGRVGALLEVGTGFSPELTGRENVYLNGMLLGMGHEDVKRRFDDIVTFAGVEQHIDTPVKWYSTGMYIRLGFAVAAHMEPEILVVDEVLSVGDTEFQKRCLARMGLASQEGRTVLLVSHNMQAVRRICQTAIMLESGRIVTEGDIDSVIRSYLASVESPELGRRRWEDPAERPGDELCRVVEVRVTDAEERPSTSFFSSSPIKVAIEFDLADVDPAFVVGFDLVTVDGVPVFRSFQTDAPADTMPVLKPGRNAVECTIPAGLLNSGRYVVSLRVLLHWTKWIVHDSGALYFDVVADHGDFMNTNTRPGPVAPVLPWKSIEPAADDARETSATAFASG
ncbi:MAG: ABC transporter ATP-binding protein [Gaiellaceae bacterium]